MSETQAISETQTISQSALQPRRKTENPVRANSLRFTPLRSAILTRNRPRKTGGDHVLSPLVPVRPLQS